MKPTRKPTSQVQPSVGGPEKIGEKDKSTFEKIAQGKSPHRRTDFKTMKLNVQELKEPSLSLPHKILGNIIELVGWKENKRILRHDIEEVQRNFEELGMDIPEDILDHMYQNEGSYITEAQAERLIELLKRKFEPELGQFKIDDIVLSVTKHLDEKNKLALVSSSFHMRDLLEKAKMNSAIPLTANELSPENKKVQFAIKNNLGIKIEPKGNYDIKKMIAIMKDEKNDEMLKNLIVCDFNFSVNEENKQDVQEFLDLLGKKCPNLTSLSFQHISNVPGLNLPKMDSLASLSFASIFAAFVNMPSEMNNLVHLSLDAKFARIELPNKMENLLDFHINFDTAGMGGEVVNMPEPDELPKLEKFEFKIGGDGILQQKCKELKAKISSR